MKLDSLLSFKSAHRFTVLVVFLLFALYAVAILVGYITLQSTILELRNQVVVIDKKGEVYSSSLDELSRNRIYEYKNHVKIFYRLWYQFDEGTYKKNIDHALELIGDRGIVLLDHYIDAKVEALLSERNVRFEVDITDVQIDLTANPVKGVIIGEQRIIRKTGSLRRKLECIFTLYDVDRTDNNPHGCKIQHWEIVNDEIIK